MKSWLKRYWLPGILAIVGAATILIAIGTATIWAPPTTINTEIKTKGNVNMVATVPGLLSLYDSDVKIRVIGNGKVSLAVGNSQDTSGWLNKQPHLSVTGLASYTELKGEMVAGKEKVTALDANNATDMWQLYKTSKSTISDTWKQSSGNWSLIAQSENGPLTLQLQWQQKYNNPLFYPLLAVGILLLVVALIIAITLYRIALAAQRELEEMLAKRKALEQIKKDLNSESNPPSIPIAAIPEGKQRPSRRKLREARAEGADKIEVDGVEYSTGLMPIIKLDKDGNPIDPRQQPEAIPADKEYADRNAIEAEKSGPENDFSDYTQEAEGENHAK